MSEEIEITSEEIPQEPIEHIEQNQLRNDLPENFMDMKCDEEIKKLVKVSKPDQTKYKKEMDSFQAQIETLSAKIKVVEQDINNVFENSKSKSDPRSLLISEVKTLQGEKSELLTERQGLYDKKDKIESERDQARENARKQKGTSKYTSLEKIDERIAEIEYLQNSTELSRIAEKGFIAELKTLNTTRRSLAATATPALAVVDTRESIQALYDRIKEINKLLSDLSTKIDEKKKMLDALSTKNEKSKIPELRETKQQYYNKIAELRDSMNKLKEKNHALNGDFLGYSKQLKRLQWIQRKQQEVLDKAKHEEEAKKEKEVLATLKPWGKELRKCDLLLSYLKTYIENTDSNSTTDNSNNAKEEIQLKDGQVLHLLKKKTVDEPTIPKKKKNHKSSQPKKLNLTLEMISDLESFRVAIPKSLDSIPDTIKKIVEVQAYFDTLPREATPFAEST